jgi:hypothetical protein
MSVPTVCHRQMTSRRFYASSSRHTDDLEHRIGREDSAGFQPLQSADNSEGTTFGSLETLVEEGEIMESSDHQVDFLVAPY